ncbi:MAG TPA: hypothetical protein VGD75_07785 [Bradyrhizobium sp.]
MRLRLYRASTTAEAMARVRSELGAEALILATRRVSDGVEITAALEISDPVPVATGSSTVAAALKYHGVPAAMLPLLSRPSLPQSIAAHVRFEPIPIGAGSAPLLFVGPPGAGKTLTAARLATRLVLGGSTPLVVTADGNRAGATEQLAAFTRILGLNLLVIARPSTLASAIARQRVQAASVLVDMPGGDPFQPADRQEIAEFVAAVGAEMVVVLPAGLDPAEAADLAAAYRDCGARLMVATRLDLARRIGGVLAAAQAGLSLSEAGVSACAAGGLVPITPDFLAERLLRKPPVGLGSKQ